MSDKLKAAWEEKVRPAVKKVPRAVYIALVLVLVVAVGVSVYLNTRPYAVLFADMNTTELQSILTYLEDNGIRDYKVEGNTILVPPAQEASLKARLLMEGYPQSGFAYTYTEGPGAFSTESERAAAQVRDLQDRLSAVVRCFNGVRDAVVTITPGEDNRYVLDSTNLVGAKAAVMLSMEPGMKLSAKYADAIRNLIAHSVKGLTIDSVRISDTAGNTYGGGDGITDGEASALKLQLEEQWENKIRTNVLQILIPYFGEDNVKVGVNCTVDVSRTVVDKLDVELPDWANDGSTGGKGIIGSQIYDFTVVKGGDETPGGIIGTETNSDLPEYVETLPDLDGSETELHSGGQIDYENDKTQTHVIRTAGYLTDCTISVSINATTAGDVDVKEIGQHVARVSGIRGKYNEETGEEDVSDRISVISMPFYEEPAPVLPIAPEAPLKMWMLYAAAGVLLFILVLTIIIVVIVKKRKKAKLKKQQREAERLRAEAAESGDLSAALAAFQAEQAEKSQEADVMNLRMEKSIELRQDLRKFAEENPEIAAQMIKNWLKGEEE